MAQVVDPRQVPGEVAQRCLGQREGLRVSFRGRGQHPHLIGGEVAARVQLGGERHLRQRGGHPDDGPGPAAGHATAVLQEGGGGGIAVAGKPRLPVEGGQAPGRLGFEAIDGLPQRDEILRQLIPRAIVEILIGQVADGV